MPGLLKQLQLRFGISAPKMTVRTHVAWYWRWLGMMVLLAVSLALAAWMYDAGRRFAGFDRTEVELEVSKLKDSLSQVKGEAATVPDIRRAREWRLKRVEQGQDQVP